MKLAAILAAIRRSKKRDDLKDILNAAEARDSKLSHIEGEKERARLWAKFDALGIQKGDMVFVHTAPKPHGKLNTASVIKSDGHYLSGQHAKLWAQPLTVREVKTRYKEIVVRVPGSTVDHRLSPFTCEKLKLSKEPSAAALAHGLQEHRDDSISKVVITMIHKNFGKRK